MLQVGESQSLDPSEKALPYPFETRVGRPTEVLSYIMNSVINDRLPGAACFFIYNCIKTCYNPNVAKGACFLLYCNDVYSRVGAAVKAAWQGAAG